MSAAAHHPTHGGFPTVRAIDGPLPVEVDRLPVIEHITITLTREEAVALAGGGPGEAIVRAKSKVYAALNGEPDADAYQGAVVALQQIARHPRGGTQRNLARAWLFAHDMWPEPSSTRGQ